MKNTSDKKEKQNKDMQQDITVQEILAELERLDTAQTKKTYINTVHSEQ